MESTSGGKTGSPEKARPTGRASKMPAGRSGEGAGSVLEQLIQQEKLRQMRRPPEAPSPEDEGKGSQA